MNDRIKLADAMECLYRANARETFYIGLPDPFTDANDDYAVLEWVRKTYDKNGKEWCNFWFSVGHQASYKIGNYARAALKLLP